MTKTKNTNKGVSLAKGPAGIVGIILLAFGVTALLFGSHSFATHAIHGTVNGKSWLGFEVNGWSALLCAGTGAALIFAAPLHWGAKTISLIVALILGDAALLAFVDRHDALGIFAANHLTELGWAIAAGVLLVVALLPRVGGGSTDEDYGETRGDRRRERDQRLARERTLPTKSQRAAAGAAGDDHHDPINDGPARDGDQVGSRRLRR
jgi:hypothetical protein